MAQRPERQKWIYKVERADEQKVVKQRPVELVLSDKILRDEEILPIKVRNQSSDAHDQGDFDVMKKRDPQCERENPVCGEIQDQAVLDPDLNLGLSFCSNRNSASCFTALLSTNLSTQSP